MAINAAYNIIEEAFLGWIPFGMTWAFSLLLTFLTLLMIAGLNTQKWKENALPIMIGWNLTGVPTHWLAYLILTIIYVNEHISITQLSEIATLATRRIQEGINQEYWKPRSEKKAYTKGLAIEYARGKEKKAFEELLTKPEDVEHKKKLARAKRIEEENRIENARRSEKRRKIQEEKERLMEELNLR